MFLKQKQTFKDLYNKGFDKIDELSNEIDFTVLDYVYKLSAHTMKLDDFIGPKDFYDQIKNSEITFEHSNNSKKKYLKNGRFKELKNKTEN